MNFGLLNLIMRLKSTSFCFVLALVSLYALIASDSAQAIPEGALPSPLDDHSVDNREVLTWPGWTENNNYSAYLKEKDVLLDKISFRASETRRGIAVYVDKLWRKPAFVSDLPGDSYAFLQLSLNGAAAESADEVTFYFTVEDKWLEFNSVTRRDIRLMAYDRSNKSWITLGTKIENGIISASAPSSHSVFSIAVPGSSPPQKDVAETKETTPSNAQEKEQDQLMEEQTQEPVKEATPPDSMEDKAENEAMQSPETGEQEGSLTEPKGSGTGGIISAVISLLIGIILVIFGIRYWTRR